MKLPIIKIKDNRTGKEFALTGSDSHDYLYADDKGIHYYNLQNGEGTGDSKEDGYSFVGENGYMGIDIPMMDMLDILSLYYEEKIKPVEDEQLDLCFDALVANLRVLDMRAEEKLNKRKKALRKKMMYRHKALHSNY